MSYTIQSTNGERMLTIGNNTFNYDTSLVLFGRHTESWAQYYNTNLLHLLENFCNEYPPGYSGQILEGQLWFDSYNKQLKLCVEPTNLEWSVIANVDTPDLEGIVTYESLEKTLLNYIPLSGNTSPLSGQLIVEPVISTSSELTAVTKKYIDSLVCSCSFTGTDWQDEYTKMHGDTITTKITLSGDYSDKSYAVSYGYLQNTKKFDVQANSNVDVTGAIKDTIAISEILSETKTIVYVTGAVTLLPNSTSCTIKLPYDLDGDYYIMMSASVLNGLDVSSTNDTGTPCDAYWTKINQRTFIFHITSVSSNVLISFTLSGVKP